MITVKDSQLNREYQDDPIGQLVSFIDELEKKYDIVLDVVITPKEKEESNG